MKAAIYHGIGDMRVEECPKPRIKAGELLVRVRAARILTHAVALSDIAHGFDLVEQRAGLRVVILPHPEEVAGALAQHPQLHTTML